MKTINVSSSVTSRLWLTVAANQRPPAAQSDGNTVRLPSRRVFVSLATAPLLLRLDGTAASSGASVALDGNLYELVKDEVRKVVTKAKAAGMLRLVFHDAGTFDKGVNSGGMNGSIVYELERPENTGLSKPVKVLEKAKAVVDTKKSVSWADIIAMAGAEAISICGGPTIQVQLGRIDSMLPDPEGRLPEETLNAFGLKQSFQKKGLSKSADSAEFCIPGDDFVSEDYLVYRISGPIFQGQIRGYDCWLSSTRTRELVALSGAHTLGSKGFGSPTVFDNSYYKVLLEKPWASSGGMSSMIGLPSDRALAEDGECLRWIEKYAKDQNLFFDDFSSAYTKLVNSGAQWRRL